MKGLKGLDSALAVAELGYRVHPIAASKIPITKAWQESATTDPEQVRRWWARYPEASVGILTGGGLLIVDLDVKNGKNGIVTFNEWAEANGVKLLPTTDTQSGGQHIYLRIEGEFGNRADVFPGVDIRGEGGQVMAYSLPPALDSLPTAPEPLRALLSKPKRSEPRPSAGTVTDRGRAYAAKAVAGELDRLDKCELMEWFGEPWDATTFAVACNLIELANSPWTGYTEDVALQDFLEHAPTDENFGPAKHQIKWESALSKVDGKGRTAPESVAADDFQVVQGDRPVAFRHPRLDIAALLDPNRPPRDWVVEGLIAAGASVSLAAPAGSMKSLLTLALCVAVARGDEVFAGLDIPKARRVLYVDMENTDNDLTDRFRALGVLEDIPELVYLHLPSLPALDTAAGGRELLVAISEYELRAGDLVVLDSTQRVVEGPENDADTFRAFYRHTAAPLKKLGLTVLRTDNTGWTAGRARGSSSKRDDVDLELLMERDGNQLSIRPDKSRSGGIKDILIRADTDDDGLLTFLGEPTKPTDSDRMDRTMCAVAGWIGEHPGAKTREIRAAQSGDNKVAAEALNVLVRQGYVGVTRNGRANAHHLLKPYAPELAL